MAGDDDQVTAPGVGAGAGRLRDESVRDQRGERRSIASGEWSTDVDVANRRERRVGRAAPPSTDEIGVDRAIARRATCQDGVVTRAQLIRLGLSAQAIDRRLARGALIALFRGVYAVGHGAVSERGHFRAALLAVGDDAVLSHTSAARAWGLVALPGATVDVTVAVRAPRSRTGLRVHAVAALDPADRRLRAGLPVTSPARTLLDIAATAPIADLEAALREARVRRLVNDVQLAAAVRRAGTSHRGTARLRGVLSSSGAEPTRSQLERAFLRLIDAAGLPRPLVNSVHGRDLVDFTWPVHGVVVEVDGWAAHGSRQAFELDRRRDADRQADGLAVLRFSWQQVTRGGLRVVARVAQRLGTRAPRTP